MTEDAIDNELRAYFAGQLGDSPAAAATLPPALAQALFSAELPLLSLVRKLGPQLTAEQPSLRARAVSLLANIVEKAASTADSTSILNPQSIRTLTTFFTDKVEDAAAILNAPAPTPTAGAEASDASTDATLAPTTMVQSILAALLTLATLPNFPAGSLAIPLADAITTHLPPIKHLLPQAQRFAFFRLFDALLARHRAAIFKQKGKADAEHDILAGYTKFAEGEKDPRNLVYAFAVDWVILTEFELEPKVVEAFFDITFCYFPITFRPPPSDPYGITTAQIKIALSRALTSTPHFYTHLFPLVLEKLSASPAQTKLDCLHLLSDAIPVWGRAAVTKGDCASKLWNVLETEIMYPSDSDSAAEAEALTNAAVNTLSVLLRTLYSADPAPERQWPQVDPPEGLAPTIVTKASSYLREPASALAPRAAKYLLGACVRADKGTAYLAAYAACDVLLPIFKDPEEGVAVRAPVLRCLSDVVHALRTTYEQDAKAPLQGSNTERGAATGYKFEAPTSSTDAAPQAAEAPPAQESTDEVSTRKQRRSYLSDNRPLHPFRLAILSALSNGLRAPVISSSTASGGYRASAMNLFVNLAHVEGFFLLGQRKQKEGGAGEEDEDDGADPELEENELEWGVREITASLTQSGATLEWSSAAGSNMDVDGRTPEPETVLEEETSAQLVARQAAILALQEIRTVPPTGLGIRLLEVDVLPQIFELLPDRMIWSSTSTSTSSAIPRAVELQRRAVRTALSTVTALCDADEAPALCELAVVRLCTKIELAGSTSFEVGSGTGSTEVKQFEENVAYVRGLLSTLATVLSASASAQVRIVALGRIVAELPTRLIALVLKHLGSISPEKKKKVVLLDPKVIRQTGELLVVLVRALGQSVVKENKQFDLARKLEDVFVKGEVERLNGLRVQLATRFDPLSLGEGSSSTHSREELDTVFLFAASYIPLSSAVPLPTVPQATPASSAPEALANWLEVVLRFTANAQTSIQADAGYALIICAMNKYATAPLPAVVQSVLNRFWDDSLARLSAKGAHLKGWERVLSAWSWAAKALLVRGGANAGEGLAMVDRMMEGVMCGDGVDPAVQKLAASSLAVVTRAEDGVLTKENGAVVRALARQRLFSHLLPKIIDGYQAGFSSKSEPSAPDTTAPTTSTTKTPPPLSHHQSVYLIAFTSILPHLPRPLLKERMRSLFPLLVRSLDLLDPSSRAAATRTVTFAAGVGKKEKEEGIMRADGRDVNDGNVGITLDLVEEYVGTLLERLLGMLIPAAENTPTVRIAALKCLATLARTVPHISIHSHANRVLRVLATRGRGIDDVKRQVRIEAVDAREAFFVLSAQKG
ncbi:hypothetical protein A4X09_0g7040 [Tilletia walkeri]|uniref:MMS19 nucleotide excision repair protein n=1 Tax=Tilletia walkeri TaxID=117179 RepID=A0A8X7T2I5_9BASI|nr:hypothetical protein A4X09_0g7040 [Tilletia walkeri]